MTRTVKTMDCTYVVKGYGRNIYTATVTANNVEEATTKLSKAHGKKGCAVILDYTENKVVYHLDDDVFFSLATVVTDTDTEN